MLHTPDAGQLGLLEKLAAKRGIAVWRKGDLFALVDADTNSVLMDSGTNGKPDATVMQVWEWLNAIELGRKR